MDHAPTGETSNDSARARRRRMRADARALHPGASPRSDGFQTPEWLDRSFVLPLTRPDATPSVLSRSVPKQSAPSHDDYESAKPGEQRGQTVPFVRPTTPEVDFARVMRRSDLGRTAARAAVASSGLAGLTLIVHLLTSWTLVLGMTIAFGVIALVTVAVRVHLVTAPLPHVDH
ncbi:MAG: hypothetical protein JWQ67_2100 [Marmoricola sp.]|jgi:hypothetical protein|nr:hypothetical protein [Marmoricola sp.]